MEVEHWHIAGSIAVAEAVKEVEQLADKQDAKVLDKTDKLGQAASSKGLEPVASETAAICNFGPSFGVSEGSGNHHGRDETDGHVVDGAAGNGMAGFHRPHKWPAEESDRLVNRPNSWP